MKKQTLILFVLWLGAAAFGSINLNAALIPPETLQAATRIQPADYPAADLGWTYHDRDEHA